MQFSVDVNYFGSTRKSFPKIEVKIVFNFCVPAIIITVNL